MYEIAIIGSGPAGLTAAIYASRANKKVCLIEGSEKCGQLMKTTYIENYPGFEEAILGPDLMINMYNQAKNLGLTIFGENALEIAYREITPLIWTTKPTKNVSHFEIKTTKRTIETQSIIVATGANAKTLGIEEKLMGKGVSTCATCDGAFYKNKELAVIGGGNTALEETIYLSKIAKKVYLIHRRNEFRAEKILEERMRKQNNIEILTPYEAKEFIGETKLEKLIISNGEEEKELKIEGAFIAIGHRPNTELLKGKIELNEQGYAKSSPATEIPGLFVAGDIHDKRYRQAITAAGYGCMAAMEAIKYINS